MAATRHRSRRGCAPRAGAGRQSVKRAHYRVSGWGETLAYRPDSRQQYPQQPYGQEWASQPSQDSGRQQYAHQDQQWQAAPQAPVPYPQQPPYPQQKGPAQYLTQQPGPAYGLTAAQKFWYVLSCIPFGAGYLAKVPAKKAMADFGLVTLTGAEAFWYILMCLPFGAGYLAKLPTAKALSELDQFRR